MEEKGKKSILQKEEGEWDILAGDTIFGYPEKDYFTDTKSLSKNYLLVKSGFLLLPSLVFSTIFFKIEASGGSELQLILVKPVKRGMTKLS